MIILGGAALGLFVGLLLGMSTSPVVAIVVTALAASLAAAMAFDKVSDAGAGRVLGTGLGAVAGVLLGLFIRTQDAAGPSIKAEVARWTAAGFEPKRAREMVAFSRLGIKPPDAEIGTAPAKAPGSNLFANGAASLCSDIATLPDEAAARVIIGSAQSSPSPKLRAGAAILQRHADAAPEVRGMLCGL